MPEQESKNVFSREQDKSKVEREKVEIEQVLNECGDLAKQLTTVNSRAQRMVLAGLNLLHGRISLKEAKEISVQCSEYEGYTGDDVPNFEAIKVTAAASDALGSAINVTMSIPLAGSLESAKRQLGIAIEHKDDNKPPTPVRE